MMSYHVGGASGTERTEGLLWISAGYTQPLQLLHHIPPLPLSLLLSHPLHLFMSLISCCFTLLLILLTALHKHFLAHTKGDKNEKGQHFMKNYSISDAVSTSLECRELLNRLWSPCYSVSSVLWVRLNRVNSGKTFVPQEVAKHLISHIISQHRGNSIATQSLTQSYYTVFLLCRFSILCVTFIHQTKSHHPLQFVI